MTTAITAIVVAAIVSLAPLIAVLRASKKSDKQLEEIHILVNSRLSEALSEIASLKSRLDTKDEVIKTLDHSN